MSTFISIYDEVLRAVETELRSAYHGEEGRAAILIKLEKFVEEVVRSKRQHHGSSWMKQWKELDAVLAQNNIPPSFFLVVINTVLEVMGDND